MSKTELEGALETAEQAWLDHTGYAHTDGRGCVNCQALLKTGRGWYRCQTAMDLQKTSKRLLKQARAK